MGEEVSGSADTNGQHSIFGPKQQELIYVLTVNPKNTHFNFWGPFFSFLAELMLIMSHDVREKKSD